MSRFGGRSGREGVGKVAGWGDSAMRKTGGAYQCAPSIVMMYTLG